ncbi:hypothetical protein ACHAW5_006544 [Stephanodiscus triporus]|uniref:Fcf2 pre-rRNA processing C-terminal domain-containing protein n=1 Tax=Stephanodiscus triporus TaxID=2934178 RepID=A0ABD3PTF2_9STRA
MSNDGRISVLATAAPSRSSDPPSNEPPPTPRRRSSSSRGGCGRGGGEERDQSSSPPPPPPPPPSNGKNELSRLVPGYAAPMRLEPTSSTRGIVGLSLSELRTRASRADASAHAPPPLFRSVGPRGGGRRRRSGDGGDGDGTAGPGWFGMVPTPATQQLRTDLSVIRNRAYLDPKKFYKSADVLGGGKFMMLQSGTVIEGSSEYYSSRLTNRERRGNLTEEVMADAAVARYAKRKYGEIQAARDRLPGRGKGAGGGGRKRGRKGR